MSRQSEEREYRIPDQPSIGGSIRSALSDFYFNSWRLVPANLLWGIALLGLILLLSFYPLAALLLTILLALPAAGIFRLATLIARDEPVSFSDALAAWRRFLRSALVTGAVLVFVTFILGFNVIVGFASVEPLLWVIGTMSVWALIATWMIALPFWALLTDPLREGDSLRERLRLAALLVLISPLRFGILFALMLALLVLSTILFAALVTISVAFIALVVVRYTLPAADRLEKRQTQLLPG